MNVWRCVAISMVMLFGVLFVGNNVVCAEMLVYKGKFKATEFNYTVAGDQAERFAWNDGVYVLIDYNYATDTVTEAVIYQYWKGATGKSQEALSYGVHNLQAVANNGKGRKSLCFFTADLHDSDDVRASLAMEGSLKNNFDIGSAVNPKVDLAKTLKGKLIDMAPYFSEGSTIFGDLHLTLDLGLTREANRNNWDFVLLRSTIEDRLSQLGVVKWTNMD